MSVEIIVRAHYMAYAKEFKRINEDCNSTHFWLKESDINVLSDPQKYILDQGGNVFIALLNGEPVGTCVLIVKDIFTCELAKMSVDFDARGRGIGYLLGAALIKKVRERGFSRIMLKGNKKIAASISLFRKLGFEEIYHADIDQKDPEQTGCTIFMELRLNPAIQSEFYI